MFKILVTSGGTQEYIDDVRVLTNISSGKLGSTIASTFATRLDTQAEIHFVYGKNTEVPQESCIKHSVRTAQEAYDKMLELVPQVDAVIHCMAVSDFTFRRDTAIKCSSSDPMAFIEYMRQTITTNPKIISKIKNEWNSKVILVGFKFEVGVDHTKLESLAKDSIKKNGCDLVVANDKEEMKRLQAHAAHFFFSDEMRNRGYSFEQALSKSDIAYCISSFVIQELTRKFSTMKCPERIISVMKDDKTSGIV